MLIFDMGIIINPVVVSFSHVSQVMNPMTLLASEARVSHSLLLLEQFKTGNCPTGTTDQQLWAARSLRDSMVSIYIVLTHLGNIIMKYICLLLFSFMTLQIHPDTGKVVPWPFRMAAFTPVNMPIVAGMCNYRDFNFCLL